MTQPNRFNSKRGLLLAGVFCLAGVFLGGCEEPLFTSDLPRTQYERYDRLRGRYVPMERMSARGGTEPSLRDRLSPR
jgi:hypothetical protein